MELHCFGPLYLSDSSTLFRTRRKKSLFLLAYLILQGGKKTRHYCCSLFWPDQDEFHGMANLRNCIYDINHASSRKLILCDQELIYASPEIHADVEKIFEAAKALDGGKTVDLQEVIDLLESTEGEFLSGFSADLSPEFEDWYCFIQSEISAALFCIRKHLVVFYSDSLEYNKALQFAFLNRQENLLDESAHRVILILYALKEDISEIQHQYEYSKTVLLKEQYSETAEKIAEFYKSLKNKSDYGKDALFQLLKADMNLSIKEKLKENQKEERIKNKLNMILKPQWFILLFAMVSLALISILLYGQNKDFLPTVAVLPLRYTASASNLSEDSSWPTSLFISQLKKLDTLHVLPYSAVSIYRGDERPSCDIYKEIGSSYIVKGVVSEFQESLRFDLRLIDGKTGELISHLVDESIPSEAGNTSESMALRINETIYSGLAPAQRQELSLRDESFDFFSMSLLAESYHLDPQLTAVRQNRMFQILRDSLSRDYVFSIQYMRNSDRFLGLSVWERLPPDGSLILLEEAERQILKTNPDSPYIDLGRGVQALIYNGSLSEAENHFSRAMQTGLDDPVLYRWLIILEISRGNYDRAFRYLEKAEELDPLNHLDQMYRIAILYYSGAFSRAIEIIQFYQSSRSSPHCIPELYKVRSFLALGDWEEAQESITGSISFISNDTSLALQAYIFSKTNREDLAEEILEEVSSNTCKALVAAGLGNRSLVNFYTDKARRSMEVPYLWLRNDPLLKFRE